MFDAALKEIFSQLGRKYDRKVVFEVWAQIMKEGGVKTRFPKGEWTPEMTIEKTLDCLDDYSHALESLIQKRLEEKEK